MRFTPERLHAARKAAGLSRLELALRAGCSQNYIYRLELEVNHTPSVEMWSRIRAALSAGLVERANTLTAAATQLVA